MRTLAKALTPAFLRFGGTKQDFMTFTPQSEYYMTKSYSGDPLPYAGTVFATFAVCFVSIVLYVSILFINFIRFSFTAQTNNCHL